MGKEEELKSRSQMRRVAVGNPDVLIAEIERLQAENQRLLEDRRAFAEETEKYRASWLCDRKKIQELTIEVEQLRRGGK